MHGLPLHIFKGGSKYFTLIAKPSLWLVLTGDQLDVNNKVHFTAL